jgi:hypothetical protein
VAFGFREKLDRAGCEVVVLAKGVVLSLSYPTHRGATRVVGVMRKVMLHVRPNKGDLPKDLFAKDNGKATDESSGFVGVSDHAALPIAS